MVSSFKRNPMLQQKQCREVNLAAVQFHLINFATHRTQFLMSCRRESALHDFGALPSFYLRTTFMPAGSLHSSGSDSALRANSAHRLFPSRRPRISSVLALPASDLRSNPCLTIEHTFIATPYICPLCPLPPHCGTGAPRIGTAFCTPHPCHASTIISSMFDFPYAQLRPAGSQGGRTRVGCCQAEDTPH